MLVTLKEVLKDAQKQKYAVGLFNTVNLEMAKGVLAAASGRRRCCCRIRRWRSWR